MTRVRRTGERLFSSLRIRNYRLYFAGQLVSLTGTWMQWVAQDWLVLRLTDGSGVAVGVTTGVQFLPLMLFGLWGGVVADRVDKRRLLLAAQVAAATLALALALLSWAGVVTVWMVWVLAFLLGCVTVVDMPTRHSFVMEMVGPEAVTNAVGLNSAVFNAARVLGPSLAAVIIPTLGVTAAFFVNTASYVAVIAALAAMDPGALRRSAPAAREPGQVRAGVRYLLATPELRATLVLLAVVGTFGLNFKVVLPLLATVSFAGGAATYGVLMAVMSVGSLAGALSAAWRGTPGPRFLTVSAAAFGATSVALAVAPSAVAAGAVLVAVGATSMLFVAAANSTLQLRSDPALRGRVMAVFGLVVLGSAPVGGPIMGWVSEAFGPRWAVALGAAVTLAAAAAAERSRSRATAGDARPADGLAPDWSAA